MGVSEAIAFAEAQIGKPYVFGATGPNSYDCSGLVEKACEAGGVHIGRTTYEQIFNGTEVSRSDLAPGDLLFPDPGHVQLYIGSNKVIEAPHTGAYVRETTVWGFWRARRVFTGAEAEAPTSANLAGDTTLISDPIGSAVQKALENLPVVGSVARLAEHLTSVTFWKRIGVATFGLFIILVAIAFINRDRIYDGAKSAAKVAKVAAVA